MSLFVHPSAELYGSDRSFLDVVKAIKDAGAIENMEIIVPEGGPLVNASSDMGISVFITPIWVLRRANFIRLIISAGITLPIAIWRAYKRMQNHTFVYVNTVVVLDYLIALRFTRARKYVHVRELPSGGSLLLFRALLVWTRAEVIFNSKATQLAFRLPKGQPQTVIYNGYAIENDAPAPVVAGSQLRILFLGRINGWKGADLLVRALATMTENEKASMEVMIVGSPFRGQEHHLTDLRNLINQLNMQKIVTLAPFVHDPSTVLRSADVLVVPSKKPEPFGRVAIEAMAFSRPVIAARHGGLIEIISEGETGIFFEPNNPFDLASALRQYLSHPELVTRHGSAGRKRFERMFLLADKVGELLMLLGDSLPALRRIELAHPSAELYGSDRSFYNSVRAIEGRYSPASLEVILPENGPLADELRNDGISVTVVPLWVLRRARLLFLLTRDLFKLPASVIKVANRIKYVDLVYVNTVVLLDYLIALRFVRAHKIVHVHEIPTGIAMAIFRALLIWSDADLIFNSQATMKAFHFGKRKRQAVVYNGYHPTGPVTEPVAESPKLCLLLLGRINGWKGADLLVEAISLLSKDEISKIDVRIVGSAYRGQEHYLTDLKKLIAKRDLCDFIEVMPFVSSPESILNWADVLVVPSRKPEPFGRVAIEAMAYSRAVIAARHGGLEEIVVNERTGFLFEPNSAENLANTIRKYLDSRDVVLKHGRAGRQRFQDYFSLSASDSAFIECLQKWAGLGSS